MTECANGTPIVECAAGIPDCCALGAPGMQDVPFDSCAPYNDEFSYPDQQHWLMMVSFCTMALMSFGIGANDAANSWGTSVGSGAVTLTQAVVTGGLMDWLGATLLGSGVSDTIQKVSNVHGQDCWACGYCNSKITVFMLGMCAALLATAVFLLLSSTTGMPVSTTHAIIGAVVGMAVAGTSPVCLDWRRLGSVALTWLTSPLLAGLFGAGLHYSLHHTIMMAPDADQRATRACPWLLGVTMSCVSALILLKSPITQDLAWPLSAGIAVLIFAMTVAIAHFYVVPMIQWHMVSSQVDHRVYEVELANTRDTYAESGSNISDDRPLAACTMNPHGEEGSHASVPASIESLTSPRKRQQELGELDKSEGSVGSGKQHQLETASALPGTLSNEQCSEQQKRALLVFQYLLVVVAALESFAHGANDTANATGAFSAVWTTYKNGLESCKLGTTPIWIMAVGGFFVFLGVFTLGSRVIQTMGFGLSKINFFRGFCIELASALAVVAATVLGIPVSTTHCQVGAVVFVGWTAFGRKSVKWSMFGWIALTWLITLPFSAGLAALFLVSSKITITS